MGQASQHYQQNRRVGKIARCTAGVGLVTAILSWSININIVCIAYRASSGSARCMYVHLRYTHAFAPKYVLSM